MCLSQTLNYSVPREHSLISNNKTSYALWSSGQFLDALSLRLLAIRACVQCEQCTKRHTEPSQTTQTYVFPAQSMLLTFKP